MKIFVRLTNQNFAAASNRRNEPIGVFIAGVLFPPSLILRFCPNSLPPPLPPPLFMPATQATNLFNASTRLLYLIFCLVT